MGILLLVLGSLPGSRVLAANSEGEIWDGVGQVFNIDGSVDYSFTATESVRMLDDQSGTISEIHAIMSNGKEETYSETIRSKGMSFSVETRYGNGGGFCFDGGKICSSFVGTRFLSYHTTQIVLSSEAKTYMAEMFVLGKPYQYLRETFTRRK